MRNPPMRPIPLADLVERLRDDPHAYGGQWYVYCKSCEKYWDDIWPDRYGLLCGECGKPLIALVGRGGEP